MRAICVTRRKILKMPFSILLVDDDLFVLQSIGPYLESLGYSVTAISNPSEALDILDKNNFDLVITDLDMDEVDGIAVLKKAKQADPLTQVIILTGYGSMNSAISALRLEADDYLLKPCEMEEIRFRVRYCLETRQYQRKIRAYENVLPVCVNCKKIRDDMGAGKGRGQWVSVEKFMYDQTGMSASSTYCPKCLAKAQKEMEKELDNAKNNQ